MTLSTGTRLGPYEIVGFVGAGGMGEVLKARDTRLDRIVAIKVLPEHLSRDPALRERFEREARAVLTKNFGTGHGRAISMCLATVVRFNADYVGERYLELGGGAESLARRLEDLAQAGGLPRRLADDGVGVDDLPKLAQEAAEQWTGGFNCKVAMGVEHRYEVRRTSQWHCQLSIRSGRNAEQSDSRPVSEDFPRLLSGLAPQEREPLFGSKR